MHPLTFRYQPHENVGSPTVAFESLLSVDSLVQAYSCTHRRPRLIHDFGWIMHQILPPTPSPAPLA